MVLKVLWSIFILTRPGLLPKERFTWARDNVRELVQENKHWTVMCRWKLPLQPSILGFQGGKFRSLVHAYSFLNRHFRDAAGHFAVKLSAANCGPGAIKNPQSSWRTKGGKRCQLGWGERVVSIVWLERVQWKKILSCSTKKPLRGNLFPTWTEVWWHAFVKKKYNIIFSRRGSPGEHGI